MVECLPSVNKAWLHPLHTLDVTAHICHPSRGEMAQEDQALEAILSYIVSSRAAWTT